MEFEVRVIRIEPCHLWVNVEADSGQEAKKLALEMAPGLDFDKEGYTGQPEYKTREIHFYS